MADATVATALAMVIVRRPTSCVSLVGWGVEV